MEPWGHGAWSKEHAAMEQLWRSYGAMELWSNGAMELGRGTAIGHGPAE